jgi:hypothetical protein
MCPPRKTAVTVPDRYNQALLYARDFRLAPEIPRPLPTKYWPKGSVDFLEKYHHWLLEGGSVNLSP